GRPARVGADIRFTIGKYQTTCGNAPPAGPPPPRCLLMRGVTPTHPPEAWRTRQGERGFPQPPRRSPNLERTARLRLPPSSPPRQFPLPKPPVPRRWLFSFAVHPP